MKKEKLTGKDECCMELGISKTSARKLRYRRYNLVDNTNCIRGHMWLPTRNATGEDVPVPVEIQHFQFLCKLVLSN